MRKMAKDDNLEGLWASAVDAKPQTYDFFEKKWLEDWDVAFAQTDEEIESEEFTPMMNYFYPLPEFEHKHLSDDEIKKALTEAGSVTLIEKLKTGEKGLALTGGGMDLSWDICKGHINLGYLPPAHFCRSLPRMGDMTLTPENKKVISACRKSLEMEETWAKRGLEELDNVEAWLKKGGKY